MFKQGSAVYRDLYLLLRGRMLLYDRERRVWVDDDGRCCAVGTADGRLAVFDEEPRR